MEIRTRETTVSELRKTGISVVGDRAWGIHLCLFYETKDDLLEMVLPYFKAGFESGEYCVWLTPDIMTQEEARKELSEILSSLGRDPDDRSFEIQSGRDLYLADGRFDRERVRVVWNEKLAHALAEGYEGLRSSAMRSGWTRAFGETFTNTKWSSIGRWPADRCRCCAPTRLR